MTPEAFSQAARRLYGKNWRDRLAKALRKDRVTVWRYAAGKTPIPWLVEQTMQQLAQAQKIIGAAK